MTEELNSPVFNAMTSNERLATPPSIPSKRSTLKSVILVLTCTFAMIVKVQLLPLGDENF